MKSKLGWFLFGFFALGVGLYPAIYFLGDMSGGLLASKPPALLADQVWKAAFYLHVGLGGLSLLSGWTQFSKRLRATNIALHRKLGTVYVLSVLISGIAGLYVAFFATGGPVAQSGFTGLAIAWLITTTFAYQTIRRKKVDEHRAWMIRSYALTFAAVTLRLWLPALTSLFGMDFIPAYRIIAWLCWVPNLIWAEWYLRRPIRQFA